ncbi:MAG: hypothetical protein QXJ74_03540 [Nitrososphaera sp.]|uniref:hypothetical protein n=1 Tax=Nitrososphaera sp. TaxID=1971748 RepID=UPI00185ADDAD|nr:hypothetical protein [Nitrososphaera sp.]NWG36731.1 hypothetical protein [Nitrososphaera sp.]
MDKFGLLPSGNSIPFEAHLEHLDAQRKEIMLDIRSFAKTLGPNVIEEVRPHRVVYAKTLTFRTFLDVEPAGDHLSVEVRSGRAGPAERFDVRTQQDLEQVKKQATQAFEKIR